MVNFGVDAKYLLYPFIKGRYNFYSILEKASKITALGFHR